jgi:alpha-N-arabinofuranosidase
MLEGLTNTTYWDWKDTLGPLKDRPGFQGVWGYQQTHGLGLMEYLNWAEDFDNMEIGRSIRRSSESAAWLPLC